MEQKEILIENEVLSIVRLNTSMYYDVWQNSLDDNNRRFVPDEVFETLEDAQEVVDYLITCYQEKEGPFVYPIIVKDNQQNIGYVQLIKIDDGWEIGYHVAQKYTGKGYATEAVKLFLSYLKKSNKLHEIYGICLADNVASYKVLMKCGFVEIFNGEGLYQGKTRDIIKTIYKF